VKKHSDLQQAVNRTALERIELYWFFQVLLERYEFLDEAFRLLAALLDAGLRLTTETDDQFIDQAEIAAALAKVESAYDAEGEAADPDKAWWDVLVAARQSDGQVYEEPIGRLIVTEGNVAEVCAQIGAGTYWWPTVKWPQGREHLAERECTNQSPDADVSRREPQALSPGSKPLDSGPKLTAFDRRCDRLRQWLTDQNIPEREWMQLDGWSLRQIYDELKKFDEFWTPDELRVEFSSFDRHFWKKQKFCKLKSKSN
jgi:hypothetical protein